jgi:ligand-binding SRPBCC domain-containing protein
MKTFERRTVIPATMTQVMAFHEAPGAIQKLTPPPIFITVQHNTRTSLISGDVDMTMWFGPLPVRWTARHERASREHGFQDRMISGPLAFWLHEHTFRTVEGGVEMTDRITYEHRAGGFWGIFTRLVFDGLPLRILFLYRHWRTRRLAPRMQLT